MVGVLPFGDAVVAVSSRGWLVDDTAVPSALEDGGLWLVAVLVVADLSSVPGGVLLILS